MSDYKFGKDPNLAKPSWGTSGLSSYQKSRTERRILQDKRHSARAYGNRKSMEFIGAYNLSQRKRKATLLTGNKSAMIRFMADKAVPKILE